MSIDQILDRRRRILLAAVERHQPATHDDIRYCAELALWNTSAFESTLDSVVGSGELLENAEGRPYVNRTAAR